ncbi:MAG: MFS transporter [Pirellula sp.]|nr:MFS transporter [Pirellula sp.]
MTDSQSNEKPSMLMFWGCFIALITTAFAFISRAFMCNMAEMWPRDFGLDTVQAAKLFGQGIWSFSISIILFSLVIDKIGYRTAMFFSVVCYSLYAAFALYAHSIVKAPGLEGEALVAAQAKGLNFLTIGSIILGLGNGTVEAFINPVIATLFSKEKTKYLNMLHAGWPGGLVIGGLITLGLGSAATEDWRLLVYIIAIPAVVYLIMLARAKFPVSERVSMGATYAEMLGEFGVIGAAIALFLIFRNLGETFEWSAYAVYIPIIVGSILYGVYSTELGTDGAITGIMEEPMTKLGYSPLWVLIYTSAIMMVLRFFAGPIVKALTPLGLLAACSVLAIVGLYSLSVVKGMALIFAAATLYGVGKTFFWPTMLGVVAEQFPKGGALTLNAIAGIGMLTVGVLGQPVIGHMQEESAKTAIVAALPDVYPQVSKDETYFLGSYQAVDTKKVALLEGETKKKVEELAKEAKQSSLAKITVFPAFMLVCYLILIGYFKSKGGYKPQTINGQAASGH